MNNCYFKFYGFVLSQSNLDCSDKLVFSILLALESNSSFAYCSNEWLSSITGLSVATIKRSLSTLKSLGFIDSKFAASKHGFKRLISCFPSKFDNYVEFNFDKPTASVTIYDWLNDDFIE